MELVIKPFHALTMHELFVILKLRVDTFVVEQHSTHQEIDDDDQFATHFWLKENDQLLAYARVIQIRHQYKIGRVIAVVRRKQYATTLLKEILQYLKENTDATSVFLTAQTYVQSLYEKLGFQCEGEVFYENAIPHIQMRLELTR